MAAPERKPDARDGDHRVIDFQSRTTKAAPQPDPALPSGKDRPGVQRKTPIDYRQRMMANLAAAIFAIILTGLGVWLVTALNHMRQTQDCVAMGLRNCGDLSSPHS